MASFTDTQPPKFNPYIQQQPVEAMVAVGTGKQKAHDEGVQKIQTNIDNLASIDVGRDVDKAYLQSKINELGNNLRTVASADFSNFQMVNSVGGMVKQISYDPYIRAGVAAKANDNKQMELMEEDRKAGKLTPHAEFFYGLKRQKYYNNNSLKGEGGKPIGYSGKYMQSWDIDKNMLEAIKAVGESKWQADNVFKMVNGQIARDKNGTPILSDYAIREKREGRFSQNVEAAIDEVLRRPEASLELTMRGVYNYRGYDDVNDFVRGYEKEKNKAVANYEDKKLEAMERVANAKTPEEKAAYQGVVNQLDSKIEETKRDAELQQNQAQEFGSLEGYKAALETMRFKNSYMKSGVTEQISTEIIENIPWKAQRQVLKEERDWKMDLDASARGWEDISLKKQGLALDALKWEQHADNIKNKLAGGSADLALPMGATFETQHGQLMDASIQAEQTMESTKFSIVSEYMSAINYGNGKTLTPAQIEKDIKKYEKANPGFIDRMYGKAKKVSDDPRQARNPLYSRLMSALPLASQAEGALREVSDITKNMNNSEEVIAAGGREVDLGAISKNFRPFEIEYATEADATSVFGGGNRGLFQSPTMTKKTVTAQDALDLAIIAKNTGGLKGMWKSFTNSPAEEKQYESAQNRIKNKFNTDGRSLLSQMTPAGGHLAQSVLDTLGPVGAATGSRRFIGIHPQMQQVMDVADSYKFNNVMAAKEAYLTKHNVTPDNIAYNVYDPNMKGNERKSTDDRVKDILNKYKVAGGVDEFNKLYTDSKDFSVQIGVGRGTALNPKENFSLNLYDASNIVKSVPISRQDAEYIKQYRINLPSAATDVNMRIQANNGTTNASGLSPNHPEAYKAAMFPNTYFMQKLNTNKVLGADVVQSPSGGFNAYLYTIDPRTQERIGVPIKTSVDDIYPASFQTADAATEYITNKITSKAYAEGLLKNGYGQ